MVDCEYFVDCGNYRECGYYDNCSTCGNVCEFYQLTEDMIDDIKHLEKEVVRLRYSLSKYLPDYDGLMLRCDILSGLSRPYYEHPAYKQYISVNCAGNDPLDCKSYSKEMQMLAHGKKI